MDIGLCAVDVDKSDEDSDYLGLCLGKAVWEELVRNSECSNVRDMDSEGPGEEDEKRPSV